MPSAFANGINLKGSRAQNVGAATQLGDAVNKAQLDAVALAAGSTATLAAKRYPTATKACAAGITSIPLTGTSYASSGMVDDAAQSGKIIAPVTGLYSIVPTVQFYGTASGGARTMIVYINGTNRGEIGIPVGANEELRLSGSYTFQLSAGDVIELVVYVTGDQVTVNSGAQNTSLAVTVTANGTVAPTVDGYKGLSATTPTVAGAIGDWYKSSSSTDGGFFGWVCVTAGAAGAAVWKQFGYIGSTPPTFVNKTQAQYDALSTAEKNNPTITYVITA